MFIPTHYVNGEVADKPYFRWIIEEKIKFEIYLKEKNIVVIFVSENKFVYVFYCYSVKQMWDTIEMIYEVPPSIK